MFVLVVRVLIKHSARKAGDLTRNKKTQATVKTLISVVSIMFMFGLQWLFGAFTIAEASLVFQWLFVIFSTLQGFFLFLFFCLLSQDAREEWLNLLTFGWRKKSRRSVITSHASQGARRDRNTGSTYFSSKQSTTLKKSVLSSVSSETSMEMSSRRAILLALPTSVAEERDTEFIFSNGNATEHDGITKELTNGHSTSLNNAAPSVEVPEHILQRRFMLQYNPAVADAPPLDREMETDDEDEETHVDNTEDYDISTADYGDLTQLTELAFFSNSDISDTEELSHL